MEDRVQALIVADRIGAEGMSQIERLLGPSFVMRKVMHSIRKRNAVKHVSHVVYFWQQLYIYIWGLSNISSPRDGSIAALSIARVADILHLPRTMTRVLPSEKRRLRSNKSIKDIAGYIVRITYNCSRNLSPHFREDYLFFHVLGSHVSFRCGFLDSQHIHVYLTHTHTHTH